MKKIIIASCFLLSACAGSSDNNDKEGTVNNADTIPSAVAPVATATPQEPSAQQAAERKLRYLYFSNGGLIGFYSDGTVAGCPRCDLVATNIEAMKGNKPHSGYKLENGKIILTDGEEMIPQNKPGSTPEWALIDYKWQIQVED